MKRTVYRGISLNEAETVIANQVYMRSERRDFQGGIQARSTFGQGLYLISDVELAAQYAFCHAEVEAEKRAAVLKQQISLENPFILNHRFTEEQLRKKALSWKFGDGRCSKPLSGGEFDEDEDNKEIGSVVREFLLDHEYDGIIYHIDDEIIYYVSYFQEKQVKNIMVDFVFNIEELRNTPVLLLRENYKKQKVN